MYVVRTFGLFILSAFAELLGAWLVWQGIRENRGLIWVGLGIIASGVYPLAATLQADPDFGRILAAYGGVFIAAAFVWVLFSMASGRTASTSQGRWYALSASASSCSGHAATWVSDDGDPSSPASCRRGRTVDVTAQPAYVW